jgi:hypothetical protein
MDRTGTTGTVLTEIDFFQVPAYHGRHKDRGWLTGTLLTVHGLCFMQGWASLSS